jgi:D-alanyl-D-alanine carboxypeptidase/D-alanyl-D-alanine-endopeptidase (penicillin-binding protein 4)
MMAAQVIEPSRNGSINDSMLTSVQTADGMVLVVPYPELVMQRLDALVDDSLMETTQLGLLVWDLTDDMPLYARNPRHLLRTASTMKLLTAITALDRLGKDYKYNTSIYYKGDIVQGQLRGDIICQGGMDPMFDCKDMQAFVQALKSKGVTSLRGRIVTDNTMKVPDKWGEGWCWDDDNPTLVPLLIDGKPNFSEQLLKELQNARINTTGVRVSAGTLPADAKHLCTRSHSISEVMKQMMKESDNLFAECTYYQVAASSGKRPAKAKDAQEIEKDLLNKIGLNADDYSLADGSGLSLYNYLSAEAQVALLRYAWQTPNIFQTLFPTLPIAGEDGTLKRRMQDTAAQGRVWAKTGTVSGVSALSGYLVAPNGHYIAFSIINQGVKQGSAGRRFQDRVCAALCQP